MNASYLATQLRVTLPIGLTVINKNTLIALVTDSVDDWDNLVVTYSNGVSCPTVSNQFYSLQLRP